MNLQNYDLLKKLVNLQNCLYCVRFVDLWAMLVSNKVLNLLVQCWVYCYAGVSNKYSVEFLGM